MAEDFMWYTFAPLPTANKQELREKLVECALLLEIAGGTTSTSRCTELAQSVRELLKKGRD